VTPRSAPLAVARLAVTLAAALLPRRADRLRYRAEFLAELHGLPAGAQLRHAAGVLSRAGALWAALGPASLREDAVPTTPRKPFRCRVLHLHRWQQCWTSDGEPYRACARCGELHPRTHAMVGSTIPWTPSI
jgi:hypothetical protein